MWEEVKKLLDENTGLSFTAINALAPLPSASYNIQTVSEGVIKQGLLSLRIYSQDLEEVLEFETTLKKLLHNERAGKPIETDNFYIHSSLNSSLLNEVVEQGLYDLAISFVIKWKGK